MPIIERLADEHGNTGTMSISDTGLFRRLMFVLHALPNVGFFTPYGLIENAEYYERRAAFLRRAAARLEELSIQREGE